MDKFNIGHIFFILSGLVIVSMKTYPSLITTLGGRDSWICVMCAGIIIFVYAYSMLNICKKNNNYNMCNIYKSALGKKIGTIFILFFLLTLILTLIECSSIEANSMNINMLPETPPWFFILFFIVPAIYTVSRGKNSVIIVTIVIISTIIFSGINLALLTQGYKHTEYLMPIMEHGIDSKFIFAVIKSLCYFGSFSIILPMLNEFKDKKSLWKYTGWTLFFIIQMEVFAIEGLIATFGIGRLNPIFFPKLIQTQLVNYFNFLESGELYVILQMLGGWYVKYILTLMAIALILKNLNIKNKYYIYLLTLIIGIVSYFISDNTILLFKILNIYLYIILGNFIIIPLIIFIIYNFKQKKKSVN
ncbi:MAG: endospore germination permease [Clostridium sp.]|nr:endospore germination permease [Clostridium sp.]